MKKQTFLFLTGGIFSLLFLFSACGEPSNQHATENEGVDLRWKVGQDEYVGYNAHFTEWEPGDSIFSVARFFNLEQHFETEWTKLSDQIRKELELEEMIAVVEWENEEMRARMAFAPFMMDYFVAQEYDSVAIEKLAGGWKLDYPMTDQGAPTRNSQGAGNLATGGLLFRLPSKPMRTGQTWQLDVPAIIGFANAEIIDHRKEFPVTVSGIYEQGTDTLVSLQYKLQHEFDAYSFVNGQTDTAHVFISYIGTGDFWLNSGFWGDFRGLIQVEKQDGRRPTWIFVSLLPREAEIRPDFWNR